LSITIERTTLLETAQNLKSLGFDHVKAVTGIDFSEENRMEVVYHISSFGDLETAKVILEIKMSLNHSNPQIPSVMEVWPSAKYCEKETAELLGIKFEGLPDSGRFLLPEDFVGTPLRKDFKIQTEGIDA
jgi:NADH-quinone oxidoreductase subunit C